MMLPKLHVFSTTFINDHPQGQLVTLHKGPRLNKQIIEVHNLKNPCSGKLKHVSLLWQIHKTKYLKKAPFIAFLFSGLFISTWTTYSWGLVTLTAL